jgi:hypothetical protein
VINLKSALVVMAAMASASCAAPGSRAPLAPQTSAAPASVAPGCDLSGTRVRWSAPTREPRLIRVTLFQDVREEDPATHTGVDLLDEPFTPAIGQVAAPDDWTARLAASLSAQTGDKIQSGVARAKDGRFGTLMGHQDDPGIPEILLYHGVETVSAGFTVDCGRTVSGTFTSWTSAEFGGVTCGQVEEPAEPLARLARRHCPRTPAPQASLDADPPAVEFP